MVIARAAAAGLAAVALTDHDTVSGVPAALAAGEALGIRVVSGCEFSVLAPWGEMHVLAYFLPAGAPELDEFLSRCRLNRNRRGMEMVRLLQQLGVAIDEEAVLAQSAGGALGRPHVARALRKAGVVRTLDEAFDKYLGRGRPAFVDKALPTFSTVASLVHRLGGIVSAAHLKDRGNRTTLVRLARRWPRCGRDPSPEPRWRNPGTTHGPGVVTRARPERRQRLARRSGRRMESRRAGLATGAARVAGPARGPATGDDEGLTTMNIDYRGKVVIVTGVGRPGQIGHATALAFGRAGAQLVLCDVNATGVAERAKEFQALGLDARRPPAT